jgi:hypothetical protein
MSKNIKKRLNWIEITEYHVFLRVCTLEGQQITKGFSPTHMCRKAKYFYLHLQDVGNRVTLMTKFNFLCTAFFGG